MPSWKSPLGDSMWEDEVIPFGPYLKDEDDVAAQHYRTLAHYAVSSMIRALLTLVVLFIVLPIILLLLSIRILNSTSLNSN